MVDTIKKYRVYITYTLTIGESKYVRQDDYEVKAKTRAEAVYKTDEHCVAYYECLLEDYKRDGWLSINLWNWTKQGRLTFKEWLSETAKFTNFHFDYSVGNVVLMHDYATEPVEVCMRDLTLEEYNELLDTLGIKNCPMIRSIQ